MGLADGHPVKPNFRRWVRDVQGILSSVFLQYGDTGIVGSFPGRGQRNEVLKNEDAGVHTGLDAVRVDHRRNHLGLRTVVNIHDTAVFRVHKDLRGLGRFGGRARARTWFSIGC